jgi:hypothetical protein
MFSCSLEFSSDCSRVPSCSAPWFSILAVPVFPRRPHQSPSRSKATGELRPSSPYPGPRQGPRKPSLPRQGQPCQGQGMWFPRRANPLLVHDGGGRGAAVIRRRTPLERAAANEGCGCCATPICRSLPQPAQRAGKGFVHFQGPLSS